MTKKLRDYFPMLQTREAILKEINNNEKMWSTFYSWEEERQEEFLDFCTGARGVKVMYDFVSKEVLNPESTPERIDELLSLLLKQEVHVMEVLQIWKFKRLDISFREREVPVIQRICCYDNISG